MVTIVADKHIPFLEGTLEPFAKMIYLPGGSIKKDDLLHADGLIVRTRTICNEELLGGTPVRLIATATIGFDHIDTGYCQSNGIRWHHAPGCNSSSVKQYMASLLAYLSITRNFSLIGKTIGIIGVGNVGRKVALLAEALGMRPLLNDPPREETEGPGEFSGVEEIAELADIISFHVPLNSEGPHSTLHYADEAFFKRLGKKPFLINTSRGPVADTSAVKEALRHGLIAGFAADVWEHEPHIDPGLLQMADIATPHIAGYSAEGKANGTAACVRAAGRFFGFGIDDWYPSQLPPPGNPVIRLQTAGKTVEQLVLEAILGSYDIHADHQRLRDDPSSFELLRNDYPVRREFEAFQVISDPSGPELERKLEDLGFRTYSSPGKR